MQQTRPPTRRVLGSTVLTLFFLLISLFPTTIVPRVPQARAAGGMILRLSDEGGNALLSLEPPLASDPLVLGLIFGGLVGLDKDLRVIPDGADRWSVSADGR